MVLGDFNETPDKLSTMRELIKEEQWVDVGSVANWCGGTPNEPTCHSKENAKRSRIDGIIVNPEALGTIHDFEIEKHEMIPTHNILRLELSRNALQEERAFLRKLVSLKSMLEAKVNTRHYASLRTAVASPPRPIVFSDGRGRSPCEHVAPRILEDRSSPAYPTDCV